MRLFFALWPPPEAAEKLAALAHRCADQFGGKPTRRATIHLTLAFLGEVSEARLPALLEAMHAVRAEPFALAVDRLGYWRHNRLLWAGPSAPVPALETLVERLYAALAAASFAADYGKHAFAPHLSLVRKLAEAGLPATLPAIEAINWPCSGFSLVHSHLADAAYESVATMPLAAQ